MIDDDDLTIDGADLMAEILAERQTPNPQSPTSHAAPSTIDDDPTVTESPIATVRLGEDDGRLAACEIEPSDVDRPTRWIPPASVVAVPPAAPAIGGIQLGIAAALFTLGIALGTAIGFARAEGGTADELPAPTQNTATQNDATQNTAAQNDGTQNDATQNDVTE